MHIHTSLDDYYHRLHLGRDIIFLYANRLLIEISSGMLGVFTAIFFYERFDFSFTQVALLFALIYGTYMMLTPLGAKLINYMSLKKLIIFSIIFLPLTILALVLWEQNQILALSLYFIIGLVYRTLYWTPYHIDFATFTNKVDRGKQMSLLSNISEIILSLTPAISGIIIAAHGFNVVFIITALFTFVSIVPLFFISDSRETYSYSYVGTFRELWSKKNRPLFLAFFGDGIQSGTRIIIWPIFIFTLLNGEYASVGLVTTFTILLLIVLRFIVGNIADHWSREKLLRVGSFFATTGWLVKIFVESGFQILVADTYHRMGRAVNRLSADIVAYDHAADNGHYIDEYTVLREMSLSMGRASVLVLAIGVVFYFGLSATFALAALATLLMISLNHDELIQ